MILTSDFFVYPHLSAGECTEPRETSPAKGDIAGSTRVTAGLPGLDTKIHSHPVSAPMSRRVSRVFTSYQSTLASRFAAHT